jgi:hypothetical protein
MDFRRFSSQEEKPSESRTAQIIVLLTAILSGSAALASQYNQLPWWYSYPLALLTLVSLAVLVKHFLWPPLRKAFVDRRERRRLNAVSRAVYVEFGDIVRRFQEFINAQKSEILPRCLIDLRNQDAEWKAKLSGMPPLVFMSDLFRFFLVRFEAWDGTYDELNALAQHFWIFMYQFHSTYVVEPLNVIRAMKKEEVPEGLRNKINLLRENYSAFLRDYETFAQRSNARLGGSPFVDYARPPEPV